MKGKTPSPNKNIPIKENLTTTLMGLLKQQDVEIESLDKILKGGCADCAVQKIEQVEEDYIKSQNQ